MPVTVPGPRNGNVNPTVVKTVRKSIVSVCALERDDDDRAEEEEDRLFASVVDGSASSVTISCLRSFTSLR